MAAKMVIAYSSIRIGDPLDPNSLVGPLKTKTQIETFKEGIAEAQSQGGKVLVGGNVLEGTEGNYV